MAQDTTFGDYYDSYNTEIGTWAGYNENDKINDEKYQPRSTAHKSFFLEFVENTHYDPALGGAMTSKKEKTVLTFVLKVLFYYKSSQSFSANEKDTWNSIDAAKKQLYDFSGGRGDEMFFNSIIKESIETDFKLVTFSGVIRFVWSMEP